jgi:hypothetical protein
LATQLEPNYLGELNIKCMDCSALHWKAECLTISTSANPKYGTCCQSGKISLLPSEDPPNEFRDLFSGVGQQSLSFLKHIRQYNATFAFASLGVKLDHSVMGGGPFVFKIHGRLFHQHGSLIPNSNSNIRYAQLYVYDPDPDVVLQQRIANNTRNDGTLSLSPEVIGTVQDVLYRLNPYVRMYKHGYERLCAQMAIQPQQDIPNLHMHLHFDPSKDHRHYNVPAQAPFAPT